MNNKKSVCNYYKELYKDFRSVSHQQREFLAEAIAYAMASLLFLETTVEKCSECEGEEVFNFQKERLKYIKEAILKFREYYPMRTVREFKPNEPL